MGSSSGLVMTEMITLVIVMRRDWHSCHKRSGDSARLSRIPPPLWRRWSGAQMKWCHWKMPFIMVVIVRVYYGEQEVDIGTCHRLVHSSLLKGLC